MDKIKIGLPRALHYYYDGVLWKSFFEELDCEVVESPDTTSAIIEQGSKIAGDEMCLSLKIYLGHVAYLQGKCDYIFIPRIDNYGIKNQTCTNFLALYDIVHNLFRTPILDTNIDEANGQTELKAFLLVGKKLGKGKEQSTLAYYNSLVKKKKQEKKVQAETYRLLQQKKIKLLLIAHPYNGLDAMIGRSIQKTLKELGVVVIDSYTLDRNRSTIQSKELTPTLYWKCNKELIGSLADICQYIDGVVFLSTFPCGPDSLVNELMQRKIKIPYLNVIIDDVHSLTGIETRLESFVDVLEQRKQRV